jgi:hypothetical protein
VTPQDRRRAHSARDGRIDEFAPAQRERLPAHDARPREPAHCAERDEQRGQAAAREQRREDDDDEDVRQRVHDVDETHHQRIDAPAEESRRGAPRKADDQAHERRQHAERERDAQRLHAAREQVAPEAIGAEPVRVGERRRREMLPVERVGTPRCEPRRRERDATDQRQHHEGDTHAGTHGRTRGSSQQYTRSASRLHASVNTPYTRIIPMTSG